MDAALLISSKQILEWRSYQLSLGGSASDIDWLIDIAGGLGWEELQRLKIFQRGDFLLSTSLEKLELLWRKHLNENIPLQYLVGKCPWSEFELEIDQFVFIPRQETEILLQVAVDKMSKYENGLWADLGTGSGALAVGLAKSLSGWEGHAVDLSQNALSIAEKNLNRFATRSRFNLHLGSWVEPLKPWWGLFDLVVSNPPYIPISDIEELDPIVRDHEPYLALSGGVDGMDACRQIVKGSINLLKSNGWLIFEHHHDQSDRALDLLLESGFKEVDFFNDLEGIRRFAIGRRPS